MCRLLRLLHVALPATRTRREIAQPQKVTPVAVRALARNGLGRHIPFRIKQPPLEERAGHQVALLWLSSARQQGLNGKRGGPWLASALSGTRVFRFASPPAWLRPPAASRCSKQDLSPSAATPAREVLASYWADQTVKRAMLHLRGSAAGRTRRRNANGSGLRVRSLGNSSRGFQAWQTERTLPVAPRLVVTAVTGRLHTVPRTKVVLASRAAARSLAEAGSDGSAVISVHADPHCRDISVR